MPEPRAIVIGLDVGDGRLVEAWCADGTLPHLARLRGEGHWAWLSTPAETLHVSAWPSLYTGTSPGRHGVYYTFQPAPGEQGAVRFQADQYGTPTVWELLAAAGKRCVVLDAPYTHPSDAPGLTQILEWGTWAHYWTPSSVPADRLGALVKACGSYPLGFEANQIGLTALEPRDLARRLDAACAARTKAARWLMANEPWDLFVTVASETHPAAHYLWPEGVDFDPEQPDDERFAALRALYRSVDETIGSILAEARDTDLVAVVSGDGGGPNHAGWHLLPQVLERLGFLVPPGGSGQPFALEDPDPKDAPAEPQQGGGKSLYGRLRGLVPESFRQAVSRHLPAGVRDALMKRRAASEVDWSKTRAFCLPTDLEGCIRLNVRGREPQGIVAPEDVERVTTELATALEGLVNPATGQPAVRRVVRLDQAMPGARRDRLPDLTVQWVEDTPIEGLRSPAIGTVRGPSPDERTGTHRAPGFVIARGSGSGPGEGASVYDLAPTLLAHFGVDVPEHVEGRDWTDGAP